MASVVAICNQALALLGDARINALTEDNERARTCAELYDDVRDAVLRGHPWNCAQERATLARLSDAPAFGFDYAYQLPADCLRVLRLRYLDQRFKVEGRRLLTDAGEAYVLYIKRLTDPTLIDPLLVKAIAAQLAHDMAPRLAKSESKRQEMERLAEKRLREARSADAQEGSADALVADDLLHARAVGPLNPYGYDVEY